MSKKALSARLDEKLLHRADRLGRRLKISRNRILEEGLALWVKDRSRRLLGEEMRKASLATRRESLTESSVWDGTLLDGLDEEPSE